MEFLKNIVAISLISYSINHVRSAVNREYDVTERIPQSVHRRQNAIPILYVNGSHYEVGFMIGQTFGKVIKDFLESYEPLREYLKIYETSDEGKQIYNECLEETNKYFPQYLVEIKGMADGANVTFHELFLIHTDDILTSNVRGGTSADIAGGTGCTTLMVNRPRKAQFIGHTEDALNATLNHFYIVSAHIKPRSEESGGVFAAREEKWEAMTYAGSLSGYASGHNFHGLVFTINTIFAKRLIRGRIPRVFLTRALLACRADINEMKETLTNRGAGTADAFRVNAVFLVDDEHSSYYSTRRRQKFYSIEVTPSETRRMSDLYTETAEPGSTLFRVNRLHTGSDCEELRESGWHSSVARQKRYAQLTSKRSVKSLDDILRILGDTVRDGEWQMFRDRPDDFVNTINLGVFDCIKKTWTLWTNNPKTNPAIIELPLKFETFISPVAADRTIANKSCFNGVMSGVSSIYAFGVNMFNNLFH